MPLNFEFKARCTDLARLEMLLQNLQPLFAGEDIQVDTYFNVPEGRLKIREGNIENALIHYKRTNIAGAKKSEVLLYQHNPVGDLKKILITALGIKAVVEKKRRIWFVKNVKIHFDEVKNLGRFVEVEAIDNDNTTSMEELQKQCNFFISLFGIADQDFISNSYSDMLISFNQKNETEN